VIEHQRNSKGASLFSRLALLAPHRWAIPRAEHPTPPPDHHPMTLQLIQS
jgi:hypothetical protein